MYYKLATVAAKWWCREITNKYRQAHFGKLDKSFEEKISLFEQALISEIHQHLELYHYITMGCCYFPDETLSKITTETNIDSRYLPIFAHLEIAHNSIYVSSGYEDTHKLNIDLWQQ